MSRKTNYHNDLVTDEKWSKVANHNKELLSDFIEYCQSTNKSSKTIYQYESQLKIVFVYIMEKCDNKDFVDLKKRDLVKFANWLVNDLQASPNRIASLKSAISSLSNYIVKVLDDEYPNFRNITSVIEAGGKQATREKNIWSEEEINECLDKLIEAGKTQIACCLSFMFNSGCRISEVLQVLVSDFDDENLRMDGKLIETHTMRTKGRGKQGKQISRYVFMKDFRKYLDMWLKEREENGITSKYLFVNFRNGNYEPIKESGIRSWFNYIEKLMQRNINPHCLRHALVTKLKRDKWPDSVIKTLIHWESIELVSVYSDISDSEEIENFMSELD